MDVDALVDSLLGEMKRKGGGVFGDRLYKDEPILSTGKRMREKSPNFVPERIREMRKIALSSREFGYVEYGARLFYEQGKFMEDYEDDCPYNGDFVKYFPTYQDLPDEVLRGYFTWRARYRRGDAGKAPLSFLFMHAYELICGIGTGDAEDGYRKIVAFAESYKDAPWPFRTHMENWRRDYIIYKGLDLSLLEPGESARGIAEDIGLLKDAETGILSRSAGGRRVEWRSTGIEAESLLDALCRLSTYRMEKSALMKDHRDAAARAACDAFARLSVHCSRRRKVGFVDGLFGTPATVPYKPFSKAVFYDPERHGECVRETPSGESFVCHGAYWTCRIPYSKACQSGELGDILHALDAALRGEYGDLPPLKGRELPRFMQNIVEMAAAGAVAEIRREEEARVVIDRSALAGIRTSAAATREALLVDEEREGYGDGDPGLTAGGEGRPTGTDAGRRPCGPVDAGGDSGADGACSVEGARPDALQDAAPAPGDGIRPPRIEGLSENQEALLRALVAGEDIGAFEASGPSLDMEVDAINEFFLDVVGDTVIEFVAGAPELIEDYREDVMEVIS